VTERRFLKRSNFVIGLGVSIVLHGVLVAIVLTAGSPPPPPTPQPTRATPIQIASIDPHEKLPLEPLPPPEPAPEIVPDPPPPLPVESPVPPDPQPVPPPVVEQPDPAPDPAPTQLVRKSAPTEAPEPEPTPEPQPRAVELAAPPISPPPPDSPPGRMPGDGDGDYVPPLRVHWTDASELISVARTLGLRLAAVNREGVIIGEIDLSNTPGLRVWRGLPYGYSNRVRMLSPSIFASRLGDDGVEEIHEIWVFVPVDRDRAMIEAQRTAVRRVGARPRDVLYVDARFVLTAAGSFRLDITNVRVRDQRRQGNG
jgi:hypothetical protein